MPGFVLGNVGGPAWAPPLRSCQESRGDGDCDNPEEQDSDAGWALALQGREHSPAQGPREEAWSWVGKVGRGLQTERTTRRETWGGKEPLAQRGQFTPFNLSRAQSTGKHSGRKQDGEGRFLGTLKAKSRILGCILRAVRRH